MDCAASRTWLVRFVCEALGLLLLVPGVAQFSEKLPGWRRLFSPATVVVDLLEPRPYPCTPWLVDSGRARRQSNCEAVLAINTANKD